MKKADAGIAVSGATDAAKSAAAIVLTRPGQSVIIDAIKESRKIFQRMNSFAIYRIAEAIRVLFFITLSIVIFNFYSVTAILIVLLAFLNDFAIMSIAYDQAEYSQKPDRGEDVLGHGNGPISGLDRNPRLWVAPELQAVDIVLEQVLAATPEVDLLESIQTSLEANLVFYMIGEDLECADLVKYIYVDFATGRAFSGIDDVNQLLSDLQVRHHHWIWPKNNYG